MSRWGKLLLVSLPLAIALTAAFRFVQHTDSEYAFLVSTFGATATQLEAHCAARKSPEVCVTAKERRSLADAFKAHHDAVIAWWWPVLLAMLPAWAAAAISAVAIMMRMFRRRRLTEGPLHGKSEE